MCYIFMSFGLQQSELRGEAVAKSPGRRQRDPIVLAKAFISQRMSQQGRNIRISRLLFLQSVCKALEWRYLVAGLDIFTSKLSRQKAKRGRAFNRHAGRPESTKKPI